MTVSVVLSTYRSPKWLEKVFWGYMSQSRRDFELVIADDGSGEQTARVIRAHSGSVIPVRHVWQRDDGFRKSRILNKAIVAARGDYLVFFGRRLRTQARTSSPCMRREPRRGVSCRVAM